MPRGLGKKLVHVPSSLRTITSKTSGGILLSLTSSGFALRSESLRSTKIIFTESCMPSSFQLNCSLEGSLRLGPPRRDFGHFTFPTDSYYAAANHASGTEVVLA